VGAHCNANLVAGKRSPDDAGLGLEAKSLFVGPESAGEPRKATSSIPAHFRLAAIGVVIAHPEVRPLRRWLNSENPVSTHTPMPVAKPCNAGSIQGYRPDVEHDEVVARAIHFGEGKSIRAKLD
jgi:hypothetical protein